MQNNELSIAIVGKYTGLEDTYLSIGKALRHAAYQVRRRVEIIWINAEDLGAKKGGDMHARAWHHLRTADGIIVPGGFGLRGIEGKVLAVEYARTRNIPYLGICLGMQIAVVEAARNLLHIDGARSAEFDPANAAPSNGGTATARKAVVVVHNNDNVCEHERERERETSSSSSSSSSQPPGGGHAHMGRKSMRVGSQTTFLDKQTSNGEPSLLWELYKADTIRERHRHRYEVLHTMVPLLESVGLYCTGHSTGHSTGHPTNRRVYACERARTDHPYFVGLQSHPEYKSRHGRPSPVFVGLLRAAIQLK